MDISPPLPPPPLLPQPSASTAGPAPAPSSNFALTPPQSPLLTGDSISNQSQNPSGSSSSSSLIPIGMLVGAVAMTGGALTWAGIKDHSDRKERSSSEEPSTAPTPVTRDAQAGSEENKTEESAQTQTAVSDKSLDLTSPIDNNESEIDEQPTHSTAGGSKTPDAPRSPSPNGKEKILPADESVQTNSDRKTAEESPAGSLPESTSEDVQSPTEKEPSDFTKDFPPLEQLDAHIQREGAASKPTASPRSTTPPIENEGPSQQRTQVPDPADPGSPSNDDFSQRNPPIRTQEKQPLPEESVSGPIIPPRDEHPNDAVATGDESSLPSQRVPLFYDLTSAEEVAERLMTFGKEGNPRRIEMWAKRQAAREYDAKVERGELPNTDGPEGDLELRAIETRLVNEVTRLYQDKLKAREATEIEGSSSKPSSENPHNDESAESPQGLMLAGLKAWKFSDSESPRPPSPTLPPIEEPEPPVADTSLEHRAGGSEENKTEESAQTQTAVSDKSPDLTSPIDNADLSERTNVDREATEESPTESLVESTSEGVQSPTEKEPPDFTKNFPPLERLDEYIQREGAASKPTASPRSTTPPIEKEGPSQQRTQVPDPADPGSPSNDDFSQRYPPIRTQEKQPLPEKSVSGPIIPPRNERPNDAVATGDESEDDQKRENSSVGTGSPHHSPVIPPHQSSLVERGELPNTDGPEGDLELRAIETRLVNEVTRLYQDKLKAREATEIEGSSSKPSSENPHNDESAESPQGLMSAGLKAWEFPDLTLHDPTDKAWASDSESPRPPSPTLSPIEEEDEESTATQKNPDPSDKGKGPAKGQKFDDALHRGDLARLDLAPEDWYPIPRNQQTKPKIDATSKPLPGLPTSPVEHPDARQIAKVRTGEPGPADKKPEEHSSDHSIDPKWAKALIDYADDVEKKFDERSPSRTASPTSSREQSVVIDESVRADWSKYKALLTNERAKTGQVQSVKLPQQGFSASGHTQSNMKKSSLLGKITKNPFRSKAKSFPASTPASSALQEVYQNSGAISLSTQGSNEEEENQLADQPAHEPAPDQSGGRSIMGLFKRKDRKRKAEVGSTNDVAGSSSPNFYDRNNLAHEEAGAWWDGPQDARGNESSSVTAPKKEYRAGMF